MAPPSQFVVHYSEIALKGNNRPEFVRALRKNISRALFGIDHEITLSEGRFIVRADRGEEVGERLGQVFGVSWFAPVTAVEQDYASMRAAVLKSAEGASARSFKIVPRRADKSFGMTSQQLGNALGSEVAESTGMAVDLDAPELSVHVDVVRGGALVYTDKRRGLGGLPLGTAGRTVHLFSGGIDSPVAAWLLMKRGTRPVYLHFYLAPTPASALDSKVTRLVKVLSRYCGKSTLVLVPFADYQLATAGAPSDLEPPLFRRFMRMTAEALAARFEANAVSTGDSLSQAASQTIWNMSSFDADSSLPVLRPLLTYDKEEIVSLAKKIGTYDLSLEEYKDCCAMITRHPRTRVKAAMISEYVNRFSLQDLVWKSIEGATLVTYTPASDLFKHAPLAESPPRAVSRRTPPPH